MLTFLFQVVKYKSQFVNFAFPKAMTLMNLVRQEWVTCTDEDL